MACPTITTHIGDALDRLIEQYKDSPKLKAMLTALFEEVQTIEELLCEILEERLLENAVGDQLDGFGEIVGLARQGFSDDVYRVLLLAKIGINTSQGDPERLISVTKLLTDSNFVQYINCGQGVCGLNIDGVIDPDLKYFMLNNIESLVAAGVRVSWVAQHDPDSAFGFDGPNVNAPIDGYGSIYDANAGGKYAYLIRKDIDFAFDGTLSRTGGYGTLADPELGGGYTEL